MKIGLKSNLKRSVIGKTSIFTVQWQEALPFVLTFRHIFAFADKQTQVEESLLFIFYHYRLFPRKTYKLFIRSSLTI